MDATFVSSLYSTVGKNTRRGTKEISPSQGNFNIIKKQTFQRVCKGQSCLALASEEFCTKPHDSFQYTT